MKKIYSIKTLMMLLCVALLPASSFAQITFDQILGQAYIQCSTQEQSSALGYFQTAAYTYTKTFKTGDNTVKLVDFLGLPAEIPATFDAANQKLIIGVNANSPVCYLKEDEFDGLVDVFRMSLRTANSTDTEIKLSVKMEKDYSQNDVVRFYFDEDLTVYREFGAYGSDGKFQKESEEAMGVVSNGVFLNFATATPTDVNSVLGNHTFKATETWYMGSTYKESVTSSKIVIANSSDDANALTITGLFGKDIAVNAKFYPEYALIEIPNQAFGSDFLANPCGENMYMTYGAYTDALTMSSFMNIQDAAAANKFTYGGAKSERVCDYDIDDVTSKTWIFSAESAVITPDENLFPETCEVNMEFQAGAYGNTMLFNGFLGYSSWSLPFDPKVSSLSIEYLNYYYTTINEVKYYLASPGALTVGTSNIVFTYNKDNDTFTCPGIRVVTVSKDEDGYNVYTDHAVYTNATLKAKSTSVEEVAGEAAKAIAYANNGVIYINGEAEASIYELNGAFVAKAQGSISNLAQGIYIVAVGNKAVKVAL